MLKRALANQSGLSVMQVVVVMAAAAVLTAILTTVMSDMNRMQKRAEVMNNVDLVRRDIATILSDTKHWQATLENNAQTINTGTSGSTLSCLQTKFGALKPKCTNNATYPFKIYKDGGALYFDQAIHGFTNDGVVCLKTETLCVVLLDLNVKTICPKVGGVPQPNCDTPNSVVVSGSARFSATGPAYGIAFNPANYAISVRKAIATPDETAAGEIRSFIGTAARPGWVLAIGGTIGNSASAGTLRADDDAEKLFEVLWNSLSNAYAPVSGGRGGSAAADWAAGKTITVPDLRGRALFGHDGMGSAATGRLLTSINGTILGNYGGSELMQAHYHTFAGGGGFTFGNNAGCGCWGGGGMMWASGWIGSVDWSGGGGSQNLPPALIVMYEIKL